MLRHLRGITLVELMISMLVGSLLITAMLVLLTTQRQLAHQVNATAQLSERMSFAASFLSRHLMEAGYAPQNAHSPDPVSFSGKLASNDDAWADTLVILSEGGRGCTDQLLPNNAGTEWRRFSVNREADKLELRCEDSEGGPYPMLDGVEAMQVQYGVDSNSDQVPDYYAAASKIKANSALVAIRVGLLLRSELLLDAALPAPKKIQQLLDVNLSGNSPKNSSLSDGRMRRSMIVTVALRNVDA